MSPENALQAALINALAATPAIQTHLGNPARIFDDPPPETAFPYVTLGRIETQSVSGQDYPGLSHAVSIHVWSRYGGRAEAHTILDAMRQRLDDQSVEVAGRRVTLLLVTLIDAFRAGDGRTTQGLMRLKIHTEPQE